MDFEERLNGCIERVGVDKVLHLMVGYAMVTTGLMYSFAAGAWCMIAVLVLSVAKEYLVDEKTDWANVWAGVTGSIVGMISYIPKDMMVG